MKVLRLFSFVFLLLALSVYASFAQTNTPDKERPLSDINWVEEVSETSDETQPLSEINWGEEEEGVETEPPDLNWANGTDKRPQFSHWLNGFLFLVYLSGCFVTAFITRDKAISLKTPPEFLIILHTFWPLELLLIPFFKK